MSQPLSTVSYPSGENLQQQVQLTAWAQYQNINSLRRNTQLKPFQRDRIMPEETRVRLPQCQVCRR